MTINLHLIAEFLGMIFSMLGAFYMSRDYNKDPRHMEKAFTFFLISNVSMIMLSAALLMIPLLIQMGLFMITAYNGLIKNRPDLKRVVLIVPVITFIIGAFLFITNMQKEMSLHITIIEVLAAAIAIYGSHIAKEEIYNKRILSFILFFVADILYVMIAYDKGLLFFGIQSAFFLYTSLSGLNNTIKNKERLSLANC